MYVNPTHIPDWSGYECSQRWSRLRTAVEPPPVSRIYIFIHVNLYIYVYMYIHYLYIYIYMYIYAHVC